MLSLRAAAAHAKMRRDDVPDLFIMDILRRISRDMIANTLSWQVKTTGTWVSGDNTLTPSIPDQTVGSATVKVEPARIVHFEMSWDSGTTWNSIPVISGGNLDDIQEPYPTVNQKPRFYADRFGTIEIYPKADAAYPYRMTAAVLPTGEFEYVPLPSEWEDVLLDGCLSHLFLVAGKGKDPEMAKMHTRTYGRGVIACQAASAATTDSYTLSRNHLGPVRMSSATGRYLR